MLCSIVMCVSEGCVVLQQNPTAAGFGGRAFEVSDLDSDSVYCLLSSPFHQVSQFKCLAGCCWAFEIERHSVGLWGHVTASA